MDIYNLYNSGMSFDDFVNQDTYVYKDKTLQIFDNISFEQHLVEQIKNLNSKIKILICAEIWCPDCMINVPVIEKMREINSNVQLSIVGREGNEEFFIGDSTKVRIPTFIVYDEDFNELGRLIEHPKVIDDVIMSGNQPNIIVTKRKYRKGEYTQDTLVDILDIITTKSLTK
ncbi:thioredoxin family protein [Clostridiaceae bacterium M8S5]|nr:thioredoxin family protein [Clostridiaceae bacterium M8S5]